MICFLIKKQRLQNSLYSLLKFSKMESRLEPFTDFRGQALPANLADSGTDSL